MAASSRVRSRPVATCCPQYHQAIELIGRRWTGAIVQVLLVSGPLRFSEIASAVPDLSDRLLSERMKELEARGLVARVESAGPSSRAAYVLTEMGADLDRALGEVQSWAHRWM